MSDESRHSAHSGQRRSDGAPAWWGLLDRGDLPADADDAKHAGVWRIAAVPNGAQDPPTGPVTSRHWRPWVINLGALLIALVVIMVGVGVDSPRSAVIVALPFGVPMVLVAVTAAVAARHSR